MQKAYNPTVWENTPSINTPLNETNLNKLSQGVSEIDNRVITLDLTKLSITEANGLIKNIELNQDTGDITITYYDGKVKADIKNGSITADKLQPNYLADITVQAETATQQATAAATSAAQAKIDADRAESYASITEPKFYLDEATMNLYMKNGVGVDFVVDDNVLYWKVA